MLIDVYCVCRRPPRWVSEVTAEYGKRMPRDLGVSFNYLAPGRDSVSSAERRDNEAKRLLQQVAATTPLIALDENGREHDSETFAARVAALRSEHQKIALVIGGADGFSQAVFARAQESWSLSRLTLPHLMVQIVLAEQLYRAWSISEGHPYHRR